MEKSVWLYILAMIVVSFLIRVLPLTLIRRRIRNWFLKSFLYYVPYVTLSVMTFPAIIHATQSVFSGAAALVTGVVTAWFGFDLLKVAVSCCGVVLLLELFL